MYGHLNYPITMRLLILIKLMKSLQMMEKTKVHNQESYTKRRRNQKWTLAKLVQVRKIKERKAKRKQMRVSWKITSILRILWFCALLSVNITLLRELRRHSIISSRMMILKTGIYTGLTPPLRVCGSRRCRPTNESTIFWAWQPFRTSIIWPKTSRKCRLCTKQATTSSQRHGFYHRIAMN